jgi:Helix-turn-helix.
MVETVGTRMRRLRGSLSQDEFARQLGVHKETIGKYERDKILPGSDVLTRLRQEGRVDINWLLTGEGGAPVPSPGGEINLDALAGAIAAVEELLDLRRIVLTPEKKAKLAAILYRQLIQAGEGAQIERAMLNDLLDLAS